MMRRLSIALLLGMVAAAPLRASESNAGTSGAEFLKIGAGARPTAMGGAFVAVADDVNAAYYNPAGLALLERPEFTAMHTQWIANLSYDYGAVAVPTGIGVFAVSAQPLRVDDIEKRDTSENFQGTFQQQDAAYNLSYARQALDRLSVGGTLRYIHQRLEGVSAGAISADAGVYYELEESPFNLGLAVRHAGPGIKFRNEADPQPFTIDAGVSTNLANDQLTLALSVLNRRDTDPQGAFGLEWRQPLSDDTRINFRTGYNMAATDSEASGLSVGVGFGIRQFGFDFAWVPYGDLGNTYRYALHARF